MPTTRRPRKKKGAVVPLDRQLLQAVELAVIAMDPAGAVVYMNDFAERMFGWTEREAMGRLVTEVAPAEDPAELSRQRLRALGRGDRLSGERRLSRRDGSTFEAAITAAPIFDAKGRQVGIIGITRDISASKEAERRREAQYALTRALAESTTLAEAVPAVLGAVGKVMGWEFGVMWMVDPDAQVLRCIEVWRHSLDRYRLFDELSRRMVFPRGVELCGKVWAAADVVWSADLQATLSPPRALVATSVGLRGAIGFPIRSGRGVIGIVTFYGTDIREPDHDLREMLHAIGDQIGLFTERSKAEQLETSIGQLRALSRRLVAVREEERARASREFHDELGQSLTGLKLDLAWVGRQIAGLAPRAPQVEEKVREMTSHVDGVIQTVRQVITELRPRVLDELGLVAAIEWMMADFRRRSGMECDLRLDVPDLDLDETRRTAVFRILQEVLTNVARHSQATKLKVTLETSARQLLLEVRDNGRGLAETELEAKTSLGLLGMRERAQACDGTITFSGSSRAGTTVTLRIPLHSRLNS